VTKVNASFPRAWANFLKIGSFSPVLFRFIAEKPIGFTLSQPNITGSVTGYLTTRKVKTRPMVAFFPAIAPPYRRAVQSGASQSKRRGDGVK
jgi:hypothetical protein